MKTPLWFPQSFFSRTLWLVLIVVLFSKALTLVYLLMNEDVLVDRQYSHGVALTLRAYWAADPENREKIGTMLLSHGRDEVYGALKERSVIVIRDDLSNHEYRFDKADIDELFRNTPETPPTVH